MPDNPYEISLDELTRSTGHAPGEPTIEVEQEMEIPHDLPLRVTPMSPASEIAAIGQMAQSRPSRRPAARWAALTWLSLIALSVLFALAAQLGLL